MACSTCDGYEFVEDPAGGHRKVDCPDCRALRTEPNRYCKQHDGTLLVDGRCPRCIQAAIRAENILLARAREAADQAEHARNVEELELAVDLIDELELAYGKKFAA